MHKEKNMTYDENSEIKQKRKLGKQKICSKKTWNEMHKHNVERQWCQKKI